MRNLSQERSQGLWRDHTSSEVLRSLVLERSRGPGGRGGETYLKWSNRTSRCGGRKIHTRLNDQKIDPATIYKLRLYLQGILDSWKNICITIIDEFFRLGNLNFVSLRVNSVPLQLLRNLSIFLAHVFTVILSMNRIWNEVCDLLIREIKVIYFQIYSDICIKFILTFLLWICDHYWNAHESSTGDQRIIFQNFLSIM